MAWRRRPKRRDTPIAVAIERRSRTSASLGASFQPSAPAGDRNPHWQRRGARPFGPAASGAAGTRTDLARRLSVSRERRMSNFRSLAVITATLEHIIQDAANQAVAATDVRIGAPTAKLAEESKALINIFLFRVLP